MTRKKRARAERRHSARNAARAEKRAVRDSESSPSDAIFAAMLSLANAKGGDSREKTRAGLRAMADAANRQPGERKMHITEGEDFEMALLREDGVEIVGEASVTGLAISINEVDVTSLLARRESDPDAAKELQRMLGTLGLDAIDNVRSVLSGWSPEDPDEDFKN